MKSTLIGTISGLVLASLVLVASKRAAAVVGVQKFADTDTLIPGGTGTFTGFGDLISVRDGAVAFGEECTGNQTVVRPHQDHALAERLPLRWFVAMPKFREARCQIGRE